VVHVQVGADNQIDVLWRHTGGTQMVEIRQMQLVKALEQRQGAALVVAAAGVDQDGVVVVTDHPGVHAGHDFSAGAVPEALTRQDRVLQHHLGIEVGQQERRRKTRRQHLFDARHMVRADLECLHCIPFLQSLASYGMVGFALSGFMRVNA
jgi:hypothetical protein